MQAERIASMQICNAREYVDLDALESVSWFDEHRKNA